MPIPNSSPLRAAQPQAAESLGLAFLARRVFTGDRLDETWNDLVARFSRDAGDLGALLDISTLVQMRGDRERGLELQATAIAGERCYRTVHGDGSGVRVLMFMTAGDLMANTPLDFLFEGSNVQLISWYLDAGLPSPDEVPEHDVAFLAVSQSEADPAPLASLPVALAEWPRPVLNGDPARIAALSRDGVAQLFADHPAIVCPTTCRFDRAALEAIAAGAATLSDTAPDLAYPIILRPLASHAGKGLEKIDDAAALAAYLNEHDEPAFFAARFFDYSGADGLFRKLRVVFVQGRPYLAHLAVSSRWMVHYLNADMGEAAHRAEEAAAMANFDQGFAARHAAAFDAMTEALGLDYYGVDCAETLDGRLVLFEADVAMLVHSMDPAELYPYKTPAMARLFAGFAAMLDATAGRKRLAA